jgi:hypothetical protein
MNTAIYWAMLHSHRATDELRFHAACWWLGQQVEFCKWRLRLEVLMPHMQSEPTPISDRQGSQYVMYSI